MELNDIWPGAGWALVDVDLQPKPSFYVTRRALANVVVGMASTVTEDPTYIAIGHPPERQSLDVWAVNGTLESLDASLYLRRYEIESGIQLELPLEVENYKLVLPPNQVTEITKMSIPNPDHTVIAASLNCTTTSECLARWVAWPESLRLVHFPQISLSLLI